MYEDTAALVLNKPAGLAVMGERHDTDLVRLAAAAGEKLYPAHRIDKVTSGAVLLAKELRFHGDLTRQFGNRTVGKVYLAITRSTGLPERGTIDLPLSVGRKNRVRVAANRAAIVFDGATARAGRCPARRSSATSGSTRHAPRSCGCPATTGTRCWRSARSPAGATRSARTSPGSATRSRGIHCSAGAARAARCCIRGGLASMPPGPAAPASRWRRHRGRTSGPRPGPANRYRSRIPPRCTRPSDRVSPGLAPRPGRRTVGRPLAARQTGVPP